MRLYKNSPLGCQLDSVSSKILITGIDTIDIIDKFMIIGAWRLRNYIISLL